MRDFQPGLAFGGLLQHSHHLHRAAFPALLFLSAEGLSSSYSPGPCSIGVAPFFAYYPLIMQNSYGIAPTTTAFLYVWWWDNGLRIALSAS